MASNDSSESKPFGMSNLFFGNPESLKLPKLPPPERALQPACQLSLRTRRPSSYDDDNEEWVNVGSDGEAGEEDNPIQTDYGVYSKRPASPSSKTAPKRKRIEGGRAAQAKKVTADLDSEDEIIVQMKQKNFSDRDVAQKLVSEGRINYDRKTIATRWARLRKALSEREDQLLDDELTDWHEGEDEALVKSFHRAERQVEHEAEKIRDKLWRYTSDLLRNESPTSRYSPRACKERYEALLDGTARIPPELDDNPAARAAEREARIEVKHREKEEQERQKQESLREARVEAERKKKQREEEATARKAKKDQESLDKKRKCAESTLERETKKREAHQTKVAAKLYQERAKEEEKIRKEQLAAKKAKEAEKTRLDRQAAVQARAQKDLELREAKEAAARAKLETIQKSREMKQMQQAAREALSARSKQGKTRVLDLDDDDADDQDEDLISEDHGVKLPEGSANVAGEQPFGAHDSVTGHATIGASLHNINTFKPISTPVSRSSASSGVHQISPRRNMSSGELVALLRQRGVNVSSRASKKNTLSQLAILDKKMPVDDLKGEMRSRGLKQSGSKAELIHRLATDDANKSLSTQNTPTSEKSRAEALSNSFNDSTGSSTSLSDVRSPLAFGYLAPSTNEQNLLNSTVNAGVSNEDNEMHGIEATSNPNTPIPKVTSASHDAIDMGHNETFTIPHPETAPTTSDNGGTNDVEMGETE